MAEAGPRGAVCGVLVGHRVAEAGQQPLLVALHDRPVEPAHGLLAGLLEGPQHLGLVLRVEVLQIRLGLEQVAAADQDGHLPALGLAGAAAGRGRRQDDAAAMRPSRTRASRPSASTAEIGPSDVEAAGPAAGWPTRRRSSAKSAAVV